MSKVRYTHQITVVIDSTSYEILEDFIEYTLENLYPDDCWTQTWYKTRVYRE